MAKRVRVTITTCTNKTQDGKDGFSEFSFKQCGYGYRNGPECMFLHTHMGDSVYDDEVECRCPIPVKYKDRIRFRSETHENIGPGRKKRVKKKAKKGKADD